MKKQLFIGITISIVAMIGSSIVGYHAHQDFKHLNVRCSEAIHAKSALQKELKGVQQQCTLLKHQLKESVEDRDLKLANWDVAQKTLVAREAEIQQLKNQVVQQQQAFSQLEAEVACQALQEVTSTPMEGSHEPPAEDMEQRRIEELETLVTQLKAQVKSLESQCSSLKIREVQAAQLQEKTQARALKGAILAVHPVWNFVIFNLGAKNGIVKQSELLVKRGESYLGKLRVTSVEPHFSIAEILAQSSHEALMPGDQVIHPIHLNQ